MLYTLHVIVLRDRHFTVVVELASFAEPELQYGQDLYDLEQ
jgi:hypothetical protein